MTRSILERLIIAALPLRDPGGLRSLARRRHRRPGRVSSNVGCQCRAPTSVGCQRRTRPPAAVPAPPARAYARRPAATVNGREVPAEKVLSVYRMNKQMLMQRGRVLNETDDQALKPRALEAVIADELLYQEALAKGVTVPAAEVETAVKQLRARAGSEEAYQKFLADSGFNDADVHAEIGRNMQTSAYGRAWSAAKPSRRSRRRRTTTRTSARECSTFRSKSTCRSSS